jgi:hypothetical protein
MPRLLFFPVSAVTSYYMAAMLLAGTAHSLPFTGQLKADLRKLAVNLVPFCGCISFFGIHSGKRA